MMRVSWKRMSDEDVIKYIRQYRQGSFRARQKVIRAHLWLTRSLPIWTPYHHDWEEMCSDAVIGLMDAIDGFDPERGGGRFSAYARVVIYRKVIDGLRARRSIATYSLDRASGNTGWSLHDTVPSPDPTPEDALSEIQTADWVVGLVMELPRLQQDILWYRYGRDQSIRSTATDLGCSESTVVRLSRMAISVIRERIGCEKSSMPTPRRRLHEKAANGKPGRGGGIVDIDDVREIHALLRAGTLKQREIAARFNLSEQQVSLIKTGRRWRQVYEEQLAM